VIRNVVGMLKRIGK